MNLLEIIINGPGYADKPDHEIELKVFHCKVVKDHGATAQGKVNFLLLPVWV